MFLYKTNIWFILINLALFCYWPTFLSSEHQYSKFWQSCFNAVCSKPVNICCLNFPLQPNINIERTLGHQHWIDVILSTLFHKTTSINIRRLNFNFQPNFNVETTLMNIDDQLCFKVDSTLMCLLGIFIPNICKRFV